MGCTSSVETIAWLICQADDRGAARQEVLRALVELCAHTPELLEQARYLVITP